MLETRSEGFSLVNRVSRTGPPAVTRGQVAKPTLWKQLHLFSSYPNLLGGTTSNTSISKPPSCSFSKLGKQVHGDSQSGVWKQMEKKTQSSKPECDSDISQPGSPLSSHHCQLEASHLTSRSLTFICEIETMTPLHHRVPQQMLKCFSCCPSS